jgi:two-component system sensor histidine kinase YesM
MPIHRILCFTILIGDETDMKGLNRFSFYTRLQVLLIVMVILPCFMTTWISYGMIKSVVIEKIKANNQQLVEVISNRLTEMIDDIAYSSNYIIQDPSNVSTLYQLQEMKTLSSYEDIQYLDKIRTSLRLAFMKTHYLNFRIFLVTPSDLTITNDTVNYQEIVDKLKILKIHSKTGELNKINWLHDERLLQNDAQVDFHYAARIIQDPISSEILGTLYIGIPIKYFTELFAKASGGQLYIMDDETNVIAGAGPVIDSPSIIRNTIIIPKVGWTLVYDMDESEVTREVSTVFFYTALLIMVCMVGFLIITVFLARSMHKPILQLKNIALKFDHDNRDVRFPVTGRDEIAALGNAFNKMLNQINQLIENIEHQQEERRRIELQALYMQIRPHFLINTLYAIKCSLVLKGDSFHSGALDSLNRILRAYMKANESHTLQEECALLRDYVTIMRLMSGIDTKLDIEIDDGLLGLKIPRMFLQPFVENSIVHGFAALGVISPTIRILGQRVGEDVQIIVSDNGSGPSDREAWEQMKKLVMTELPGNEAKHARVGLYATTRRLKLTFGTNAWIDVQNNDGKGVSFIIHIPVTYLKDRGELHV